MNAGPHTLMPVHAAGASVALGLIGATVLLGIKPALESRVDGSRAEREMQDNAAEENSLRAHVRNGRTQLDLLEAEAATSRVALEPLDRLATRLRSLAQIAEARDVVIDRLEPGTVRDHSLCVIVGILMNAQGTPAALTGMMHDIADQHPEISVRSVQLTSSAPSPTIAGSAGAEAWVSGRIELDWYAARPVAQTGAAP